MSKEITPLDLPPRVGEPSGEPVDLEDAKDELEDEKDFVDEPNDEPRGEAEEELREEKEEREEAPTLESGVSLYPSSQVSVPREVESEFEKFVMLVQGSDTRDTHIGGISPFDIALMKINNPEERAITRLDHEALLEVSETFGRDSPLASVFKEILKGTIMISRADKGELSKLLVTNIQYSHIDKNVSRRDKSFLDEKKGFMGLPNQTPQPNYEKNY